VSVLLLSPQARTADSEEETGLPVPSHAIRAAFGHLLSGGAGRQVRRKETMLNEEKIRLMTRLTVYEEGLGIKDERTAEYFQNDYVLSGLIGSFVAGTLAWGVCAAVYCGYFFEEIFFSVYEDRLGEYIRLGVTSYLVFILLFLAYTFAVYYRKSAAFARRRRMYEQDLEELTEICDREMEITDTDGAV